MREEYIKMSSKYQICTRCIMDTTDPDIMFDKDGVCSNCHHFDSEVKIYGYNKETSNESLKKLINKIKEEEKNKEYDCILGISGGVDSAYMAYLASEYGLRVLAVHVDAGWNTEIAVENIQKICEKLKIDLHTIVVDWPTMKELQRAYMFSGLPNLDVPQDHVFLASMYQYAARYKIKYMLNGSNLATEGILPKAWGYTAVDFRCIKSVYKNNGRGKSLEKYPHFNLARYYHYQKNIERVNLLNYIPYSKKEAIKTLEDKFGWNYYGGKHFESRFTKFFQSYYLPRKFGYDKKRAHLSSLIVGGEMSRETALLEMDDNKSYPVEAMLEDRDYILRKLDISEDEWKQIMKSPNKSEDDYKNSKKLIKVLTAVKRYLALH